VENACPTPPDNPPEVDAIYPSGHAPEKRLAGISSLCSYGMSKLVMTGALRQFFCQYFSDTQSILNASLRARLQREGTWQADPTQSGIVIESLFKWDQRLTEKRPAILIKSGEWTWSRIGIGDQAGEDWQTGQSQFYGCWSGSHVLFCIMQEPGEAEILATEVYKALLLYASELSNVLNLARLLPISCGEVAQLKESQEHFVVPVGVAYMVQEAWSITPEAPRLKRITFATSALLSNY